MRRFHHSVSMAVRLGVVSLHRATIRGIEALKLEWDPSTLLVVLAPKWRCALDGVRLFLSQGDGLQKRLEVCRCLEYGREPARRIRMSLVRDVEGFCGQARGWMLFAITVAIRVGQ